MIPQIIHYCWFGGKPLPSLAVRCIESWRKYCPDYEIKEWNESNFDLSVCSYVKEAYAEQKWAFVSDYARFWILYHEGGVYFDTDVELIRTIDDICKRGAFMGCEWTMAGQRKDFLANPGLGLAAPSGLGLYKNILEFYNQKSFYRKNGFPDLTTVVTNVTAILETHGWKHMPNIQCIDGIYIYPPEYFGPMNHMSGEVRITENTRSIHHYSASWKDKKDKRVNRIMKVLLQRFGEKWGYKIWCIYAFPYRFRKKMEAVGIKGTVEFAVNRLFKKEESGFF